MLTAAAGLIGTLSVLRFGLVGLGAVARFAGGGLGGVVGNFGLLRHLPRLQLSRLIAPLRWTARFVGRIPWVRLAGRLALSSLVTPLRWTAGLSLVLHLRGSLALERLRPLRLPGYRAMSQRNLLRCRVVYRGRVWGRLRAGS
jgi:hypothetical protein